MTHGALLCQTTKVKTEGIHGADDKWKQVKVGEAGAEEQRTKPSTQNDTKGTENTDHNRNLLIRSHLFVSHFLNPTQWDFSLKSTRFVLEYICTLTISC